MARKESVKVEIQIRGRVKRGRFRTLGTATKRVESGPDIGEALRDAIREIAAELDRNEDH